MFDLHPYFVYAVFILIVWVFGMIPEDHDENPPQPELIRYVDNDPGFEFAEDVI